MLYFSDCQIYIKAMQSKHVKRSLNFSVLFFFAVSVATSFYAIQYLLDVVQPLNESYVKDIYLDVEYFVNSSKYIGLFAVHLAIFVSLGMLTILATGLSIYSFVLHICAVFKIAKKVSEMFIRSKVIEVFTILTSNYIYQMETLIDKDILRIPSRDQDRVILETSIHVIKLHRRNLLCLR